MRKLLALGVFALLVFGAVSYVLGLRAARPPAPPAHVGAVYPWGALHVAVHQDELDELERSVVASFHAEPEGAFDRDRDGVREYAVLVLSGGGSAGAFGAGLLSGWSTAGTRPDFKIVTGVSTGALQATFAFLGSEYDDSLTQVFQRYGTERIYVPRGALGALFGDSAWDTAPLRELIETYIDDEVLAGVAAKHARGHRLFVGTSNMDTKELVIWDMGAIASSDRPDRLARYRDVLLASCSIPVLFPPVYFPIEFEGESYHEMHMDGGAQSQVFLRDFMLDLEDAIAEAGILDSPHRFFLFIVRNGRAGLESQRDNVAASTFAIASEMIEGVFNLSTSASLYRIAILAARYGIDFNLAAIPDDFDPDLDPVIFDLDRMKRLYEFAYSAAARGFDWAKLPPGLDPDEILMVRDAGRLAR